MARIRTLKPSIWTDERFIELGRDARLLFVGMISQADDEGRLVASGVALIGAIYPHDEVTIKQVEKWRDEIANVGLATVYRAGKGTFAALPGWKQHQYIQKKQKSTLPVPTTTEHQSRSGSPAGPGSGRGSDTESDTASGPDREVEVDKEEEVEVDPAHLTSPRLAPVGPAS